MHAGLKRFFLIIAASSVPVRVSIIIIQCAYRNGDPKTGVQYVVLSKYLKPYF